MHADLEDVRIEMLGRFRVAVGGRVVTEGDWPARRARELVALLALADGRRLVRDQVVEQLWPHLGAEAGAANLRKAAHHARRTLGDPDAIVLHSGRVELFPTRTVTTDVERFLRDAGLALRDPDADGGVCARAAAGCAGELLPDARYDAWTQEPRRLVQTRLAELLRRSADWERLLEIEPTDEPACRELMRTAIDAGRRHVAIPGSSACGSPWSASWARSRVPRHGRCMTAAPRAFVSVSGCSSVARSSSPMPRGSWGPWRLAGRRRCSCAARRVSGSRRSAARSFIARTRGGWRVITAAAAASGAPYGVIGAAIEQLLVGRRASLEALPERTRSILAELSPLAGPAPPLRGSLTRHHVVAALRRALARPGSSSPTVLCVEDAHLLDEATADVLHQLVVGGGGDPLLVMLACRAEWMRTSLPHGITELARSDRTMSLQLGPLDDGAIAELVALAAPVRPAAEAVARIVGAAHGSPFFALELTRAPVSALADALPQTVRQVGRAPSIRPLRSR